MMKAMLKKNKYRELQKQKGGEGKAPAWSQLWRGELKGDWVSEDAEKEQKGKQPKS